ncbi:MAG: hypothetical protein V1793_09695 [Pseudomonadota bacterium]
MRSIISALILIPALAVGLLSVTTARAQGTGECIRTLECGAVNWSTGQVKGYGKASPPGREETVSQDSVVGEARAQATRNLICVLKTIGMVSEQILKKNPASRDFLQAGIEKAAMDAVITEQHFTSDCAMEVTLETSIFGGFLQLVLPEEIGEISHIETITSSDMTDKETSQGRVLHTGLVLDARGLDFQPGIYPVIISELGDAVYSAVFISREYAVHQGVCKYVCSMDPILSEDRVGLNPMVIKALRKGGKDDTAIVISRSDAETIEKATEFHSLMRECKVMILLD